MKDAYADLAIVWSEETFGDLLDEGDGVAFGVIEGEKRNAAGVFGEWTGFDFVGEEKIAHAGNVWGGEGDFGEEIVWRAPGDLLEFDALAAVDGEARAA